MLIREGSEQLRKDLLRIRDERNAAKEEQEKVVFNSTSFSEINGYYFLFSDLLLFNLVELELSRFSNTVHFFTHYKINMETIRNREQEHPLSGNLTLGTVNNLLNKLESAIKEFC